MWSFYKLSLFFRWLCSATPRDHRLVHFYAFSYYFLVFSVRIFKSISISLLFLRFCMDFSFSFLFSKISIPFFPYWNVSTLSFLPLFYIFHRNNVHRLVFQLDVLNFYRIDKHIYNRSKFINWILMNNYFSYSTVSISLSQFFFFFLVQDKLSI